MKKTIEIHDIKNITQEMLWDLERQAYKVTLQEFPQNPLYSLAASMYDLGYIIKPRTLDVREIMLSKRDFYISRDFILRLVHRKCSQIIDRHGLKIIKKGPGHLILRAFIELGYIQKPRYFRI